MTIAIHISSGKNKNARDSFNFKCFTRLAAEQPSHHFIFIFETNPGPELYLDPNCTPVIIGPLLKNNLLRHYWYNYKVPRLLEKYNADVFITAGHTCSIRTAVPQCMVIESLSFSPISKSGYWKKYLPVFLKKADAICITNPVLDEELILKYGVIKDKITVVYPGFENEVAEASQEEIERVKEKYTGGNGFFVYEADMEGMHKLVTMLKAFSIFKKWQKSEMQLAVILKSDMPVSLTKELSTYKYRNEIILIKAMDEALLLPAAYAVITFPANNISFTGLQAMRQEVPLITSANNISQKFFSDAALYTIANEKGISEKMMLLYKDEQLRTQQIRHGIAMAAKYSWQGTLSTLWKVLNDIAKQ